MPQQQQICLTCQCKEESCEGCTNERACNNCNSDASCCCSNSHIAWHRKQVKKGISLEYFSLGWMSVEVVASVVAGLVIGRSLALLAFGGDSVIELISAYAVFGYLRKFDRVVLTSPEESERTERIATALLIILVPIITVGAIYSYVSGIKREASLLGIAVAIGAVVIMPVLWLQKKQTGRRANILSLTIDAIESATCFFMALALLGGLLVDYFLHMGWADYAATAVILGFVILEIRESIKESKEKKSSEIV